MLWRQQRVSRSVARGQQTQAARGTFAAVLGAGSVDVWGQRCRLMAVAATSSINFESCDRSKLLVLRFAATLGAGSVVPSGDADFGDDSAVEDQLLDVQQSQASCGAFAESGAQTCGHLGQCLLWWRKQCRTASTVGCTKSCRLWWRQQCLIGSAARCAADQRFWWASAAILFEDLWSLRGSAGSCGHGSGVQRQLCDVQQTPACVLSTAAILVTGSLVT